MKIAKKTTRWEIQIFNIPEKKGWKTIQNGYIIANYNGPWENLNIPQSCWDIKFKTSRSLWWAKPPDKMPSDLLPRPCSLAWAIQRWSSTSSPWSELCFDTLGGKHETGRLQGFGHRTNLYQPLWMFKGIKNIFCSARVETPNNTWFVFI